MNEAVINIGIVGAGENTIKKHISGFQAIDQVRLLGVCNRTRTSSEKVASQFVIEKVYDNWLELVADPDINAVLIGTWPYLHCPITLEAIAREKHVLCEARMAMNVTEARYMFEVSRLKPHLVCQIVPSPLTLNVDKTICRLIAAGYLGDMLAIEIEDGNTFIDPDAALHWRQDRMLSGHNIMTLGIWYEAIMRWVGEADQVMAMGHTFVKMRKDKNSGLCRSIQIPDHLDVLARMSCGAQAHIRISQVTGLAGPARAVLYGSEGSICFQDNKLFGAKKGDVKLKELNIAADDKDEWRVEESFINAIRGLESVKLTTLADGVRYMRFTDAVIQSIAQGRAVALDEI
jgi:predicted dehydrogenase